MKSKVTDYEACIICDRPKDHTHHLELGANRKKADQDGLTIPLCHECHAWIHDQPRATKLGRMLAQAVYEQDHTRQEFLKRYEKSNL